MGLAILLLVIGTSIWVYFDATKIGVTKTGAKLQLGDLKLDMGPVGWLVCCLLLWIVAFPVYIIMRPQFIKKSQSPGLESPGLESPGLESPGLESPGLESPGLESPGLSAVVAPVGQPMGVEEQLQNQAKTAEDGINTQFDLDEKKNAA